MRALTPVHPIAVGTTRVEEKAVQSRSKFPFETRLLLISWTSTGPLQVSTAEGEVGVSVDVQEDVPAVSVTLGGHAKVGGVLSTTVKECVHVLVGFPFADEVAVYDADRSPIAKEPGEEGDTV